MSKALQVGDIIDLEIDRLSFTGKGIGRQNNFVVFVPHTIPGDHIRAEITNIKRRYADGRAREYLKRSELSIEAPCRHFGICGGCSFQNLEYERQLEYKQDAVLQHLLRIGKFDDPPLEEITGSKDKFFYRNKMEFSFKPDPDKHLVLGLHHRGEWNRIFDVDECLLQSETSNKIVKAVRDFFIEWEVPAYHISEHHGYLRFLTIRESRAKGEIMLILVTNRGDFEHQQEFIEMIKANFSQVVSIIHVVNSKKANIAIGESEEVIWGQEYISEKIAGNEYIIRPSSFFQTNSAQTKVLYDMAADMAGFENSEDVLDLYTGCGTIAIHVSDKVNSVFGVELNEDAIRSAQENCRINNIENCSFEAGDVRKVLDRLISEDHKFDTIIMDPPRGGIGRKIIKKIVRLSPKKIVYVSCNPSTLSSDLKDLKDGGYNLESVSTVDMFPHTFHIESVSRLTR